MNNNQQEPSDPKMAYRAHFGSSPYLDCPLCWQLWHIARRARIETIATRRNVNQQEIVNIALLIICPHHGMIKRIGCFSDWEFERFQGGILETTIVEKDKDWKAS